MNEWTKPQRAQMQHVATRFAHSKWKNVAAGFAQSFFQRSKDVVPFVSLIPNTSSQGQSNAM